MNSQRPNLMGLLIISSLFGWGAWETRYWLHPDDQFIHWILLGFTTLTSFRFLFLLLFLIPKLIYRRLIMRATDRAGSADWANKKEIRKAGLYKPDGVVAGMDDNKPVWVNIESSGLVLSPAGAGKTSCFSIPVLCKEAASMLVPDIKCNLGVMTAKLRHEKLGHETVFVNPAGHHSEILGKSARYNPLQILIDDWDTPAYRSQLLTDAHAIARQLSPDHQASNQDPFWRNGTRKFLVFSFLYLVIIGGYPTLSNALGLLSDSKALERALAEAAATDHLNGDLARRAKDILTKFEIGDPKQIESFREGAVQALEIYAPSGELAEATSYCDFRFSDMRKKKMTIYLMADPTRMGVFAPWVALLSWCALIELLRTQPSRKVVFLLEEATNIPIQDLPKNLTLLREFKIVTWIVMQELEQWVQCYGPQSLEPLLSQTQAKIIMGSDSLKVCQMISDLLGQSTIKTKSYNLGRSIFDDVTVSLQDSARNLKTADEVRRTEGVILILRKFKPLLLRKIGYNEIKPWSKWVGINPLFGTPYKGKTRLRL
ncbi:MAG: type IV secretory system conjugative DNA transfer family protein [Candidatus Thiodiazotropha sp.]